VERWSVLFTRDGGAGIMTGMATTPRHDPVLRTTTYEQVSSFLLALAGALVLISVGVGATWFTLQSPERRPAVPVELVEEDPGGEEDGAVDETLRVDAPAEEERPDASLADVEAETTAVQESMDTILELADQAVEQQQKQFDSAPENTGKNGKASGTGRRALGKGGGKSGFPREERWYVQYPDRQPLDEYARLLDYFGIEIGVLAAGKLMYLGKLTRDPPEKRESSSGSDEKRLYMTWQGGGRRLADLQLLRKGGIEPGAGTLFHFYPADVEQTLARLEFDYGKRKADQIRRTYFAVKTLPGGRYEFTVTRQTSFR
jgi:hypothetical protein